MLYSILYAIVGGTLVGFISGLLFLWQQTRIQQSAHFPLKTIIISFFCVMIRYLLFAYLIYYLVWLPNSLLQSSTILLILIGVSCLISFWATIFWLRRTSCKWIKFI